MGLRRIVALILFGILALALSAGGAFAQNAAVATASASLQDNAGDPVGTARFVEGPEGVVVTVEITGGISPGRHALHIHQKGDLSRPDFESAGDHFNPTGANHGFQNPQGPHAGDLPNITVAEDGTASYRAVNGRITLSPGPRSVLDPNGSAIIVHKLVDDYVTNDDPQTGPGTSGSRIAAGVIEASGAAGPLPETGGIDLLALAGAALALAGVGVRVRTRRLRA